MFFSIVGCGILGFDLCVGYVVVCVLWFIVGWELKVGWYVCMVGMSVFEDGGGNFSFWGVGVGKVG